MPTNNEANNEVFVMLTSGKVFKGIVLDVTSSYPYKLFLVLVTDDTNNNKTWLQEFVHYDVFDDVDDLLLELHDQIEGIKFELENNELTPLQEKSLTTDLKLLQRNEVRAKKLANFHPEKLTTNHIESLIDCYYAYADGLPYDDDRLLAYES